MPTSRSAAKSNGPSRLAVPHDIGGNARKEIAETLNGLLADAFALYVKTKNFHWHMSGPHFRDYHLLLDKQADQILATTDPLAERVRKLGHLTLHSVSQISAHQTIKDNDEDFVAPSDMLAELHADNAAMAKAMRKAHGVCDDAKDIATASMLEVWTDETERRAWFLFEAMQVDQAAARA